MQPATLIEHTFHNVRFAALARIQTETDLQRLKQTSDNTLRSICPDQDALNAIAALTQPDPDDWPAWEQMDRDYLRHMPRPLLAKWTKALMVHVRRKEWTADLPDQDPSNTEPHPRRRSGDELAIISG